MDDQTKIKNDFVKKVIDNFCGIDLNNPPSIIKGEAKVFTAEFIIANKDNLNGYGTIVYNFKDEVCTIVPWPVFGKRKLVPGTGIEGGTVEDVFTMKREGDIQFATNNAVKRSYITGWYSDPATASSSKNTNNNDFIYTHEANYHPDGGQIFFSRNNEPFVMLLAKATDDVKIEDFKAFYFSGEVGLQILPSVWHQPAFSCKDNVVFDNRQGKVHACVGVDFFEEFGGYIKVPLCQSK